MERFQHHLHTKHIQKKNNAKSLREEKSIMQLAHTRRKKNILKVKLEYWPPELTRRASRAR